MNSKSGAARPWERAEDQAGPYTLRHDGGSACLFLQPEGATPYCPSDSKAAFGQGPCLLFGASCKNSHVLPAARLAAQLILQQEARAGSPEEAFEVPVWAGSPFLWPPPKEPHCL